MTRGLLATGTFRLRMRKGLHRPAGDSEEPKRAVDGSAVPTDPFRGVKHALASFKSSNRHVR